jgi:hypothetical protein
VTAEIWPAADERLVRGYRRLLLAYSGHYRRRHGTEMITTMLEMAEPGRSRPSAGEAWHLIHSGVRQRFRLPSGRPLAVAAAVLATLVLGAFGAAAGSWAGQGTFAGLPGRDGALALLNAAVTDPVADSGVVRRDSLPGRADSLTVGSSPREQHPDVTTWTAEEARDGLAAAGWSITGFTIHPGRAPVCVTGDETDRSCVYESRYADLTAGRDGLVLHGRASDALGGEPGTVFVGGVDGIVFAERTAAYLPLTVAGGLLGALAGWLLTATFAYRIRSVPPGSGQLAAASAGVAVAASVAPVWAISLNAVLLGKHLSDTGPVYTLHSMLLPGSHPDGTPPWLMPALTLAALTAAAIAVTVLLTRSDPNEPHGAVRPV